MNFFLMLNTKDILKVTSMVGKKTMKFNVLHQLLGYWHSSKYLIMCSAEEINSYRFETTWEWVNDIFILKWTIPLNYIRQLKDITTHFTNLECNNKHDGIKLCKTIQVTLYNCSVSLTVPLFTVVKVLGTDNELHMQVLKLLSWRIIPNIFPNNVDSL